MIDVLLTGLGFSLDKDHGCYSIEFPGSILIGIVNQDDELPQVLSEPVTLMIKTQNAALTPNFPTLEEALNWIDHHFRIKQSKKAKFLNS